MTPITDLQPFIDLELHTVPLNGKYIKRDDRGKKHGYSFISDWQKKFTSEVNELPTKIGGLLPIEVIAIDCDDTATYNLFKNLDPTNTAFMDSIGKLDKDNNPLECGTILYLRDDNSPASFRGNGDYAIDYFSGTGMIFLPTEANATKTTWLEDEEGNLFNHLKQPIEFKPLPQHIVTALDLIKQQPTQQKTVATTGTSTKKGGFLGRVFQNVSLKDDEYHPIVTKILTPKEYRNPTYEKQGHLHPNDISAGASGHMYLFKIACILASDNTVDKDLLIDTIEYINGLWDEPEKAKKIHKEIIAPIVSGKQLNPQGEPYFEYDENWEDASGFSVITKRDSSLLEIFFDSNKSTYYLYNVASEEIRAIPKRTDLVNYIRGVSGTFDQKELDDYAKDVHTHSLPTKDYGYFGEADMDFNLFKASPALKILHDPSIHKDSYKVPNEFIAYIEHFIPEEEQRTYFLQLLRTKLTTFRYSPVVPYIIGVQGSGKNTIMTVLENIMGGKQYVKSDVGGEMFLEKYNDWLRDVFFVQLNELGDTVTSASDKKKAQGILKNYTGSKSFECRAMHTSPMTYPQTAMFIMTANQSPLTIEDSDRRLYYISTPNTFDHSPQCVNSSPVVVYNAIMAQTLDIAYWLATEHKNLQDHDYVRAPEAEGKQAMVFESLNSSTKIAWSLANQEFDLLMEWLINPSDIFNIEVSNDRVTLEQLGNAYANHSSNDDPEQIMKLAMKSQGFKANFGSHNSIYYIVKHITEYDGCHMPEDEGAEDLGLEPMRS